MKIGIGQDSHRFAAQPTPLVLGGVPVDHPQGFAANSDGDVVLHALTNAVSGVTCVNILGPVADRLCLEEGITDSAVYLREALRHLTGRIANVSLSIECAEPKINPLIPAMRERIAALLGVDPGCVGITATSGEGLTAFGRGEGVQVFCALLVEE